jgi:hypothetical protein
LIKQERLHRDRTTPHCTHDRICRNCEHVWPEVIQIRIEREPTEAAGIVHAKRRDRSSRRVDAKSIPRPSICARGVLQSLDRSDAVHDKTTGHSEVQSEGRSVGIDEHDLAQPSSPFDSTENQRISKVARADSIIKPHTVDPAPNDRYRSPAPYLGFQTLRHDTFDSD